MWALHAYQLSARGCRLLTCPALYAALSEKTWYFESVIQRESPLVFKFLQ